MNARPVTGGSYFMRTVHRLCLFTLLVITLAACGGTPTPTKPTIDLPDPNQRTVVTTAETARAQSAVVPLSGGTLTATDADGAVYTLTIPAGALLTETEVTMTPLASLSGAPVEGRLHGVALEPSGLRLYQEATLEIAPADGEATRAIGFAA